MPKVDLTIVPIKRLKAEVARREAAESKSAPLSQSHRWVCTCGNTAEHSQDTPKTFIEFDKLWCRLCYPDKKLTLHSKESARLSTPMRQLSN